MVTRKRIIIPIFDYGLTILIFDKWNEVKDIFGEDLAPNAITKFYQGSSIVAIDSHKGSSIVHEAEHIKNNIWNWIGYEPQINNDEVDAYVITYIYNKITDVFYKHNNNKDNMVRR